MIREKIITDNTNERIRVVWDGERFALIRSRDNLVKAIIILNPREMMELVQFASRLGGD